MTTRGPQEQFESFIGAISNAYVLRLDIANDFRARSVSFLNMDAAIVITLSWDGVTDQIELDPADSPSFTMDNFHPPGGTVYAKSASATPRLQLIAWA